MVDVVKKRGRPKRAADVVSEPIAQSVAPETVECPNISVHELAAIGREAFETFHNADRNNPGLRRDSAGRSWLFQFGLDMHGKLSIRVSVEGRTEIIQEDGFGRNELLSDLQALVTRLHNG